MSELGDALRRHPTPGGEEVPPGVIAAALAARKQTRRRPSWLRGPAAVIAALVLAVPVGYAVAEGIDSGGGGSNLDEVQMQAVREAEAARAALDAMLLDTAAKAEAGELQADVDQAKAAETLRAALDPPRDTAAANKLEDEMIALSAKLRESGDLPQIGGDFDRTWGLVGSLPGADPESTTGIDPSNCPAVISAFADAGLTPPTAYADCP